MLFQISLIVSVVSLAVGDPQAAERLYDAANNALARKDFVLADNLLVDAYEAVSTAPGDALHHRAERDLILAARRETLRAMSQATDQVEPLCRLRAFLTIHDTALKDALGPAWQPSDSAGVQFRIAEIDGWLVARKTAGKEADCQAKTTAERRQETVPPTTLQASPAPPTADSPTRDFGSPLTSETRIRANRLQLAGATVLTGALLPLSFMGYGLVVYTQRYRELKELRSHFNPNDQADQDQRHSLFTEGKQAFIIAVAAGSAAAVLIGTGAALLARSRKLRRQSSLTWAAAPGSLGLVWHGRF